MWLKWRRLLGRTGREIKCILLGERGQKISHVHASLIWLFRSPEPSIFIYHNRIAYLNIPHSLISVLNLILISKASLKLPTLCPNKSQPAQCLCPLLSKLLIFWLSRDSGFMSQVRKDSLQQDYPNDLLSRKAIISHYYSKIQ